MAPSLASFPLVFNVKRRQAVLVPPSKPTPHELKPVSDIDNQEGLRIQIPMINFYSRNPSMEGRDPARVIREALGKALVFYYPYAGRLREGPGCKLLVECTGEGALFIEADADIALHHFGDMLVPPFPCTEELLYDVPGSQGVIGCPLILIQVTRLTCGGFIVAYRFNHVMSDGTGLVQFMRAVGEMARGARAPSISPVWQRHLLNARDPPRVTFVHHEYDEVAETKGTIIPPDKMAHRSFFFGSRQIAALRNSLPHHLRQSTTFELLTACLWKCRTVALGPGPEEEARVLFAFNARAKFHPPIPAGFYGNACAFPVAVSSAGKLCRNPLGYALELVKKAKLEVSQEYMQSMADLIVLRDRAHFTVVGTFLVSDLTRAGFGAVDFGWGEAVYSEPINGDVGDIPGAASYYNPYRNTKAGEDGIVVTIHLPDPAMERFVGELEMMISEPTTRKEDDSSKLIRSAI